MSQTNNSLDFYSSFPQTPSLFYPPRSDTNTQRIAECLRQGMCDQFVHNPPNITSVTVPRLRHRRDHSVRVLKQQSHTISFIQALTVQWLFCLVVFLRLCIYFKHSIDMQEAHDVKGIEVSSSLNS